MANPTSLQKDNRRYLWFSLLGLGFQPDTATSALHGKASIAPKRINLGVSMFDKPNKDACYIVVKFLLEKLNPTRFHEAYRHCWPVFDHRTDAEFRKITCAWLREIMEETATAGSKVVASLFLSPGGPKFTSLMLRLATHVMQQEMKTFTAVEGWTPEAAIKPASTLDMAVKRFSVVRSRFLRAAVDQDRFLQEYQRRSQLLVKSVKELKADDAEYDALLRRHSSEPVQDEADLAEKIKKVRSLWSTIDGMLSTIKEEQSAVQSVLKGDVDQHMLDGTNRTLNIPRCLLERIEQLPHQLSSGNVYEGGQLNLLCVAELMNHALQLLKEEQSRVSVTPKPQISPQSLQDKCHQMARMLQDLHHIRQKLSKEEVPQLACAIRDLEATWDKQWKDTLEDTPLVSFLNDDSALGFLSPMAPLSFEPASEATYRSSIFSQFPAKLLDEKTADDKLQADFQEVQQYSIFKSPCPAPAESPAEAAVTAETSAANTSLDWLLNTSPPPCQSVPSLPAPQASVRKTARVHWKETPVKTKTEILDMEYENLADQFAEAVTTTTPSEDRGKGSKLEDILSTLQTDPFSARKQLPRTPERLIMDVKSSWRKAVEEDEAEKLQTAESNDGTMQNLLPLGVFLSPNASSQKDPCSITSPAGRHDSPPACQQEVSPKSSLWWDTFNTEAADSPSGTGSSAAQFTLDHETLPELPSCDSLLSLEDEAVGMESEGEDELLIPSLKTKPSPLRGQMAQACSDGLKHMRTPECLRSEFRLSASDSDWIKEPKTTGEATDKIFSLDLDNLETPSPSKNQDYSLPKLISFSPIDDMKC